MSSSNASTNRRGLLIGTSRLAFGSSANVVAAYLRDRAASATTAAITSSEVVNSGLTSQDNLGGLLRARRGELLGAGQRVPSFRPCLILE